MKRIKFFSLFLILIFITSCSSDFEEIEFENLPFLQLSEEADINNLTEEQQSVITLAASRFLRKINDDGLIELKVHSAKEVNVSENIYIYFKNLVENTNNFILRSNISYRNRIISRSPEPADANMYDCVAQTIAKIKGKDLDYVKEIIKPYFTDKGVLLGNIQTVLELFGPVEKVPKTNFRTPETFENPCVVICQPEGNPENIGHAYYGTGQEPNGFIKGRDVQNNCDISMPLGLIYDIYMYK